MTLRSLIDQSRRRIVTPVSSVLPPDQVTDLRHRFGRYRPWETGFDLTPPPPPLGELTGPPDFVGVGVPMAGGRWWSDLIAAHPGVTHHERLGTGRHYLSHFASRAFDSAAAEHYEGWFPRRSATITGEWTPTYLGDPWVPPLLAKVAPDARILMVVRDPITRLQLGLARSADRRVPNAGAHMAGSIDRSFYAGPLQRLLDHFPPDRVLVLQYERCSIDPARELATTYRFLELDDAYRPADLRIHRPTVGPPPLEAGAEQRLVDLYAADVADLCRLVPTLDLSLWPRFAGRTH